MRAAAVIVLIVGAGLLAYLFLFRTTVRENEIAQAPEKKEKATTTESTVLPQANSQDSLPGSSAGITTQKNTATGKNEIKEQKTVIGEVAANNKVIKDSSKVNFGLTSTDIPTTPAPVKTEEDKKTDDLANRSLRRDVAREKADIALKEDSKNKELALKKTADSDADGVPDLKQNQTPAAAKREANNNSGQGYIQNPNIFRGRVTDANNNALPFANVTNTRDNVGTYSDARGNFTLVSTDTVLNVQVRSLGFENNNVQLRNYVQDNQVTMREDRSLAANILDTIKRNASRARNTNMKFEEPEPADGWDYYDTYLSNNLNVPETFETKKAGRINEVQVSFEVNKDGEPINIKIEKSLCDKCDKEAIRLIKEGPKWKRKAKKGRTTVTVPFPQ
jgi:TonB family protein